MELFRKVDELRGGASIPVLIYPSHEDVLAEESFIVCWTGWYIGCEESGNGKHSKGMTHRPPTTEQYTPDNQGYWAVFWRIRELRELPQAQQLPISAIQTIKGGWRKAPAAGTGAGRDAFTYKALTMAVAGRNTKRLWEPRSVEDVCAQRTESSS